MYQKLIVVFCYLLLVLELAVAQNLDTISVRDLSLKQKPPIIVWYVHAPNLSYGNFFLLPGLGFVLFNKKYAGVAIELKKGTMIADNIPADF